MRPELVIFDCDGVLVDSEPITVALLREDLAQRGLDLDHAQIDRLFTGGTMRGVSMQAAEMGADTPSTGSTGSTTKCTAALRWAPRSSRAQRQ